MRSWSVLASDAERDAAAEALRDHVGEGRITLDEFRARLDQVYAARTRGDLDRALAGLAPPPGRDFPLGWITESTLERRARLERRYRRGWARFVRVNAVVWSIWLAATLVSSHAVALYPLLLTLPWGVARLVYAPRFRSPNRA
jgi:uncharacterized protein DUF1707